MGGSESSAKAAKPAPASMTPTSSRRHGYLNRLGIQKAKKGDGHNLPRRASSSASFFCEALLEPATAGPQSPSFHSASGSTGFHSASDSTDSWESVESKEDDDVLEMKRLDLKSPDDFRISFLRKLSYEKVWVPAAQRPPKHQSVIIFDWDDTLLCTSFLTRQEETGRPLHPSVVRLLAHTEKAAIQLLEKALQMGHTFIITNALNGWVEYSAAKYIPGVLPVLKKIRIISARSRYEALYPQDVSQWKIRAFVDLQRELSLPVITNLNSLGDSHYEMDATHIMGREFDEAFVKTVKFQERPTPEELLKELQLVEQRLESVVGNAGNLRVSLERKKHVDATA